MFADAASHVAAVAAQAAESAKAVEEEVEDQEGNVGEISGKGIKEKGVALTDSARRAGHQARDDLETYLREKFPKQRRDAAVARMKKVVQDIQQNTDFQEMVDFVVELLRGYVKRIGAGVQEEGGKTEVLVDENFETAMKFLKVSFDGGREEGEVAMLMLCSRFL